MRFSFCSIAAGNFLSKLLSNLLNMWAEEGFLQCGVISAAKYMGVRDTVDTGVDTEADADGDTHTATDAGIDGFRSGCRLRHAPRCAALVHHSS